MPKFWTMLKNRIVGSPQQSLPIKLLFCITFVLAGGGLGIWIEIYRMDSTISAAAPVQIAAASYIAAVALPALSQIALQEHNGSKILSSLCFFGAAWFGAFLFYLFFWEVGYFSIRFAGFLVLISVVLWWMATSSDPSFADTFDPDGPAGGSPDQQLLGDDSVFRRGQQ
ncbi:MAG: hypothetical protein ACOVN5_09715 [Aquidulcibacter sp.]